MLPGRTTAIPVTSVPKVSSKNLQELIHKLSVDERTKPHQFWDTQPVPKLGLTSVLSNYHSLAYIYLLAKPDLKIGENHHKHIDSCAIRIK